jgi:hypothetical protein
VAPPPDGGDPPLSRDVSDTESLGLESPRKRRIVEVRFGARPAVDPIERLTRSPRILDTEDEIDPLL